MSEKAPQYLLIGEILRPHGVRGEMRMRVLTDYPERIPELKAIYLGETPEGRKTTHHTLESMRMHKGYGLIKLKTITDRNEADRLRGLFVMVSLQDAIPLEEDEVYLFQLIGLTVKTEDGTILGELTDVLETGANDVYIVHGEAHGEVLIPVLDETILETNIEDGYVLVRLPDGLLQ